MKKIVAIFLLCVFYAHHVKSQNGFSINKKKEKVDILYDGKLLTAYCYFDSTEKPILFPLKTLSGITVTRGYPIAPRAGERTDHPHHTGLWFNYESVNGLDFWNNSFAIAKDRKHLYGSIKHQKIISSKADKEKAFLKTLSHWVDQKGNVLLEEITTFTFSVSDNSFIIDRSSTLNAKVSEVIFKDVKDGMLGLRVARELEMPSQQQDKFVDAQGNETTVPKINNEGVNGMYINKEGVRGDSVWSTRSAWTLLTGKKNGETISIVIIDHPRNINYPTYWHARGYGLFAANPLGQKIFTNGKEELNFKLRNGEATTFSHRIVIHSGEDITPTIIEKLSGAFAKQ